MLLHLQVETVSELIPVLQLAKQNGLKLALHMAEVMILILGIICTTVM